MKANASSTHSLSCFTFAIILQRNEHAAWRLLIAHGGLCNKAVGMTKRHGQQHRCLCGPFIQLSAAQSACF
eukprot:scaffold571446_cov29-Prasinocladus_malaysianus.AAC.1